MSRFLTLLAVAALPVGAPAQQSAPVTNLRYQITYTAVTAAARSVSVTTRFQVAGAAPVLLSLPCWTPGRVRGRQLRAAGVELPARHAGRQAAAWDKTRLRHLADPPHRRAAR